MFETFLAARAIRCFAWARPTVRGLFEPGPPVAAPQPIGSEFVGRRLKLTNASMEDVMQPESATDHIALLSLMIAGTLIKRLEEVGQLDEATARQLHKLVVGVRTHAHSRGLDDLNILFDNIDRALGRRLGSGPA